MAYTRAQFIKIVAPIAKADSEKSHILASLTIAQAILESADGNSTLATEGKALFGIKASSGWRGKVWTGRTVEYYDENRTVITAGFRAYDSWKESIEDHSKFLTSKSHYAKVVGEKDYKKACLYIYEAGYATDPNYTQKLISLIEANDLTKYDTTEEVEYTNTIDELLFKAVSTIIKSGVSLEFNRWKHKDLMILKNVPALVCRLTRKKTYEEAINRLVEQQIITQRSLWDKKTYKREHIRALLIKYAAYLTAQKKES
ncbi:glycoside hydrolase family 73 protein [Cellulosilyticum ruminicola]|uniref:glycoside hydrolase family 73 protein n=1 Tax=Cellulosilyticum ruminicola TaxID=425254 RepID=UPI0006D0ADDC|nr:glucosaminidase domain-containing protein [Cellulosilyticum ruminicola]